MEPGKQTLDLPAAPARVPNPAVLCCFPTAHRVVWTDQLHGEAFGNLRVQRIAIVSTVPDQRFGSFGEKAPLDGGFDELGFTRKMASLAEVRPKWVNGTEEIECAARLRRSSRFVSQILFRGERPNLSGKLYSSLPNTPCEPRSRRKARIALLCEAQRAGAPVPRLGRACATSLRVGFFCARKLFMLLTCKTPRLREALR